MEEFNLTQDELYSLIHEVFVGYDTQNILGLMHYDELLKIINLAYCLGRDDISREDDAYRRGYHDGHDIGYREGYDDRKV